MQYGSIGWSVGATLGYAQAVPDKRVIACIGDGSFQVRTKPYLKFEDDIEENNLFRNRFSIYLCFHFAKNIENFCLANCV